MIFLNNNNSNIHNMNQDHYLTCRLPPQVKRIFACFFNKITEGFLGSRVGAPLYTEGEKMGLSAAEVHNLYVRRNYTSSTST